MQELAAMATGGGGHGQVLEPGLRIEDEVGYEELLGVDGLVERETRELDVASQEDPTRRPESHRTHMELRDWRAG